MKYPTLFLGIIAAGCAAASIYLGVELAGTRAELEQQIQARNADQARIRELEAGQRRLAAVPNTVSQLSASTAEGAPQPASPPVANPMANSAGSSISAANPPAGPRPDRANLGYNGPGAQDNRRLQQEIRLRRQYAEMPAALGLDASQADKLFDLLADNRVAASNDSRAYQGDPIGRESVESAAREQRDAAIEALLGPDKAAEFHYFEKSIPARMQVNRIGESMAAANVPLSDSQRSSLIAAVYGEQESRPMPERIPNPTPDYEARFIDWQTDYSRRVQARVEPLLTSEQLARYREAVAAQNARRAEQRARVETRRREAQP